MMNCRTVILLFFISGCSPIESSFDTKNSAPSHDSYSELLTQFVDSLGRVDYESFSEKTQELHDYLALLDSFPPNTQWNENEEKAYWINLYNAGTLQLILQNYPLESIRELHPSPYIPFLNTIWHHHKLKVGDENFSLDEIEHDILRKKFNDPRIHFAINCASISCPKLNNEAYLAENLEELLNEQAIDFINNPTHNKVSKNNIKLSPLFNWFSGDFTKKSTLVEFLNQYSEEEISKDASIEYLEYNWGLNGINEEH